MKGERLEALGERAEAHAEGEGMTRPKLLALAEWHQDRAGELSDEADSLSKFGHGYAATVALRDAEWHDTNATELRALADAFLIFRNDPFSQEPGAMPAVRS